MCLPVAAAVGMSLISSGAGILSQREAARDATKRSEEMRQRAIREGTEEANAVRAGSLQRRVAIAQELENLRLRALKAKGTAQAAAGSAGVGGPSLEALLADFDVQEARFRTGISLQEDFDKAADDRQLRKLQRDVDARIFSMTPNVKAPSFALSALAIGAGAVGAASQAGAFDPTPTDLTPDGP